MTDDILPKSKKVGDAMTLIVAWENRLYSPPKDTGGIKSKE